MTAIRSSLAALALLCTAAVPLTAQGTADTTSASSQLLPAGYGTLNQDDLSLRFRTTDMEIRFIPLDERVLRLLAPDAYQSLKALLASHRAALDSVGRQSGASEPGIALVSFFGRQPGVRFDPTLVNLSTRGRLLQPIGIVPLSPTFSSQQLGAGQQASALFLFDERIPVTESFQVSYSGNSSDDWQNRLDVLDRERSRVAARMRAGAH